MNTVSVCAMRVHYSRPLWGSLLSLQDWDVISLSLAPHCDSFSCGRELGFDMTLCHLQLLMSMFLTKNPEHLVGFE